MIYFFTWNSTYLIKQQVLGWKKHFIEKYGDFNCVDISNINDVTADFLVENISGWSFLWDKKLIIINLDSKMKPQKEEELLNILPQREENNIVLLYKSNPDKRTKFIKSIIALWDHKEFNALWEDVIQDQIQKKYSKSITPQALRLLIQYKSSHYEFIIAEIEKLSISYNPIEIEHIKEHILPEFEESIFMIIDAILAKNIPQAISMIQNQLSQSSIYPLYSGLIGNLKNTVFIGLLKKEQYSSNDISQKLNLKNKSFLIQKQYKMNFTEMKHLYINLVNIDKANKSGKLLEGKDTDFEYKIIQTLIKAS